MSQDGLPQPRGPVLPSPPPLQHLKTATAVCPSGRSGSNHAPATQRSLAHQPCHHQPCLLQRGSSRRGPHSTPSHATLRPPPALLCPGCAQPRCHHQPCCAQPCCHHQPRCHHQPCLLQDGAVEDLPLDRQLRLQAHAVGLRPDEPGIHQLHLQQACSQSPCDTPASTCSRGVLGPQGCPQTTATHTASCQRAELSLPRPHIHAASSSLVSAHMLRARTPAAAQLPCPPPPPKACQPPAPLRPTAPARPPSAGP